MLPNPTASSIREETIRTAGGVGFAAGDRHVHRGHVVQQL
jgi:hypothetical protein